MEVGGKGAVVTWEETTPAFLPHAVTLDTQLLASHPIASLREDG